MLYEDPNVRQIKDEPRRRWFSDDEFDLIVWYGRFDRIVGFELCYDTDGDERAVIWKRESGYSHHRVDKGTSFGLKASPVLATDGEFDHLRIAALFQQRSTQIDQRAANFVYQKLKQYPVANRRQ
jgi:hypothetical protein